MRKRVIVAIIVFCISLVSVSAFAHSGGLDKNGGHLNHKNGTYHYHR